MQESVAIKSFRGRFYKVPEDVVLVTSSYQNEKETPELAIAILALNNKNIPFTRQQYKHNSTEFGEIPNLIILTEVFTRYEILDVIAQIEYSQLGTQRHFKGKTFVTSFAKAANCALSFYSKQSKIIKSSNHIQQSEVKKEIIQQFEILSKILSERKHTFDIIQTQKDLPLTDIVVFCYLQSIIINIPNTYPDYILRTAYKDLFKWYVEKQSWVRVTNEKNKVNTENYLEENKQPNQYINELDSYLNVNWKRFGISLLLASAVYAIYAK